MINKSVGGMWVNKKAEKVNWFVHRFASINGYRWRIGWSGSKENRERSRRQYVNDMKWVKSLVK